MRYATIARYRGMYPVTMMCRVLDVSRPGFYAWTTRPPSAQAERRAELQAKVEALYYQFKRRYGAPRLTEELNAEGVRCSENYIAKLLKALNLKALNGKGFRYVPAVESKTRVAENVLGRDFSAPAPDRKWVSDITYIKVGRVWAYLAVVMDLYSRRVVGWALDTHMRETLIIEALEGALERRRPEPGLLVHSDRGVQYRGTDYGTLLTDAGIRPSMSRKGNCWDNAVMESFFARLKVELIYPEAYRCIERLRAGLFEYIEIFHNRNRRHSALGYLSPAHFESLNNHKSVSTICG